jgi:hypothetical protein
MMARTAIAAAARKYRNIEPSQRHGRIIGGSALQ